MISGIQVGVVDKISLWPTAKARIDIKMSPDVLLYEDAAIGKRATSLIGESFVVLSARHRGQAAHPRRGRVSYHIDEPTIQSMQGQVSEITEGRQDRHRDAEEHRRVRGRAGAAPCCRSSTTSPRSPSR